MEQEKIKAYYQMWSEAWKYFKRWAERFNDDESFWQNSVAEAERFASNYTDEKMRRFAYRIAYDALEQLEYISLQKVRG